MRRKDREIKDIKEIINILANCKTAHLAMVDEGRPYVVPLSYGYVLEEGVLILYFHSAKEGRKLDILRKNPNVCFEISCEGEALYAEVPCNSGYYFSSIIGDGQAVFVEDVVEKCKGLAVLFEQQTGREVAFTSEQADSVCVFKVVSGEFSGKQKRKG